MMRLAAGLGPGLLYGALAFLAGGVLGPLRELVLAPRLGGLPAALLEAALMAVLLLLAARLAAQSLPHSAGWPPRAGMALVALALVLLADSALGLAFEAAGLAARRAPRGVAERGVGLALLAWLAALPLLVRRR